MPLLRHYNVLTVVPLLRHLGVATVRMAMLWGHSDFSEWPGAPCVRPLSQQHKGDNKTLLLVVRVRSALSQIWTVTFQTCPKPSSDPSRGCEPSLDSPADGMGTSPRHIQRHHRSRVVHIGVSLRGHVLTCITAARAECMNDHGECEWVNWRADLSVLFPLSS